MLPEKNGGKKVYLKWWVPFSLFLSPALAFFFPETPWGLGDNWLRRARNGSLT